MYYVKSGGVPGVQQDKEWLLSERDKFTHDLDRDKDGSLDAHELTRWLIPDNKLVRHMQAYTTSLHDRIFHVTTRASSNTLIYSCGVPAR